MAARSASSPETVTDWMGSLREMKEGWCTRRRRGGSGSESHFEETGSKQENLIESWAWSSGNVCVGIKRA